jgi:fused signal recognition particle receptor
VLAVREELDLPIRYVGVGEMAADLRPFDAAAFADRLLA